MKGKNTFGKKTRGKRKGENQPQKLLREHITQVARNGERKKKTPEEIGFIVRVPDLA